MFVVRETFQRQLYSKIQDFPYSNSYEFKRTVVKGWQSLHAGEHGRVTRCTEHSTHQRRAIDLCAQTIATRHP